MLGPGRYLLGVAEIALLAGFAGLGAASLRRRFLSGMAAEAALLATAVLALALLLWIAELLGSFGAFTAGWYLSGVAVVGGGIWALDRAGGRRGGIPSLPFALPRRPGWGRGEVQASGSEASGLQNGPHPGATRAGGVDLVTIVALVIATIAVVHFAGGVRTRLSTGMTGFDSTWYHGPFAAGFFQSGNTWDLHFIAPQFLAWFYPANGEIFHAVGMLAFGRDLLSPALNLGWFVGCLFACWCIGRPYRVAPWSLALGAIALSVPALSDQAGEARNDIVGIFFLLAAVGLALNAWAARADSRDGSSAGQSAAGPPAGGPAPGLLTGELAVVGLAAGLAAGTKLNFLLPAAVLVLGLVVIAPRGDRWRALLASGLAALAGGGYWYLRNLAHTGNPLPWVHHLGPIDLPAPAQALGGREAHSVIGYLSDSSVWSDWFLPGLHHGLWIVWPLLGLAALAGLVLCLAPDRDAGGVWGAGAVLPFAGLVGLATALAWLLAPTSASGPDGMPRGFESGLRYLAPALILGLALLPATSLLRSHFAGLSRVLSTFEPHSGTKDDGTLRRRGPHLVPGLGLALVLLVAAVGYPVQRHYLKSRYADPSFTTPGLDAAFAWARDVSGARIATTSTRQYPLFGTDLSNRVQYIGTERPHGGFEPPETCPQWRRLLNAGDYDYVVTTRDRIEPGRTPYPDTARWTEAPNAKVVLRKPPTVVFQLRGPLDPSACP